MRPLPNALRLRQAERAGVRMEARRVKTTAWREA